MAKASVGAERATENPHSQIPSAVDGADPGTLAGGADLRLNFHPAAIRTPAWFDLLPENWAVQN